ncbi:MAG: DUF4123 domain-containing protein [Acidovorax sp.]|jgi:hypothetical protein|nr:DUF4123 domain-containing protein [Acidovorax sp.]
MTDIVELDYRFFQRYRYAIVDAEWKGDIPEHWRAVPIAPSFLGKDIFRCPLLIDAAAIPQEECIALLVRLEEETAARADTFISLSLACEKPFRQVLTHLRNRLVIRSFLKNKPRQFRYFDPGTFIQLPDIFGNQGMAWLLGPIDAIAVPWLGEWRNYANPSDKEQWRFKLNQYIERLQDISIINRVLVQIENIENQEQWREASKKIHHSVDYARRVYGLMNRDDFIAFSSHAWMHHPNFHQHPFLQKILSKLVDVSPEDELDYLELTSSLSESDWEKIAMDMQSVNNIKGIMS